LNPNKAKDLEDEEFHFGKQSKRPPKAPLNG
jgi:hypothetical protein